MSYQTRRSSTRNNKRAPAASGSTADENLPAPSNGPENPTKKRKLAGDDRAAQKNSKSAKGKHTDGESVQYDTGGVGGGYQDPFANMNSPQPVASFDPGMSVAQMLQWKPNSESIISGAASETQNTSEAAAKPPNAPDTWEIDPALSNASLVSPNTTHQSPLSISFPSSNPQTLKLTSASLTLSRSRKVSSLSTGSSSSGSPSNFSFASSFSSTPSVKPKISAPKMTLSGTGTSQESPKLNPFLMPSFSFSRSHAVSQLPSLPSALSLAKAAAPSPLMLRSKTADVIDPGSKSTSFAFARGFHPSSSEAKEESLPIPPPPSRLSIPKAVTDKVSSLELRSESVCEDIDTHTRTLNTVANDYKELRERVEELEIMNDNLTMEREDLTQQVDSMSERLNDLQATSEAQHIALEKFGDLFKEMGGSDEVPAALGKKRAKKAVKVLKAPADNILNTGIRKVFYQAMGLPITAKDGDLAPPAGGGFWIPDPETPDGKLLRPDWTKSFNANIDWHDSIIKFVKTHLPSKCPTIKVPDVEQISDEVVRQQLGTIFKGIMGKYRAWVKKEALRQSGEQNVVAHDNLPEVKNRRSRRKDRKLDEREDVWPREMGELWDFFFQACYQSTDESDHEDALDPDTESDQEVSVSTTQKAWITRTPEYRSEEFDAGVVELDVLTKILRGAVCAKWLALNEDQDTPSRIAEEEGQAGEN
ncbi:hypothetical protein C8J57DRAFT_1674779 [Mycena rebaudengoi]|nr:hypothetical protein C8J57DRAFT_1674779 [Mycena rebaudengoi]